jgi:hypothetical protein
VCLTARIGSAGIALTMNRPEGGELSPNFTTW